MSTHSGPNIVEDGLVLLLDAADNNSYPLNGLEVEYLIVAGGGGGGSDPEGGGGGGAGGLLFGLTKLSNTNYTITVGSGGSANNNGQNSSAFGFTSIGGGRGAGSSTSAGSGGSGGGGAYNANINGGSGTSNQGNSGGFANGGDSKPGGGGGGGAGSAGSNAIGGGAGVGNGGNGLYFGDRFGNGYGENGWFSGGGGGGGDEANVDIPGDGGIGGGGDGGVEETGTDGQNGLSNTGGGGGGSESPGLAGSGGSGIVLIRYKGLQKAKGGTVTEKGGYTIHAFTSSGTFEVGKFIGSIVDNSTGELQNGVGSSTDNLGALDFDGVDDYIDLGTQLNSLTTFAVEGVFKTDLSSSSDTYQNIWGAGTTDDFFTGISIGSATSTYNDESFHAIINRTTYQAYVRKGSGFYFDGKYHHFVVNIEPGNNTIYIDGELQSITYRYGNINTDTGGLAGISNNNSYIGRRTYSISPGYFNGKIPLLRIYNRGLTNQEVSNNYNSQKSRFGL